jgi:hypothetical protein
MGWSPYRVISAQHLYVMFKKIKKYSVAWNGTFECEHKNNNNLSVTTVKHQVKCHFMAAKREKWRYMVFWYSLFADKHGKQRQKWSTNVSFGPRRMNSSSAISVCMRRQCLHWNMEKQYCRENSLWTYGKKLTDENFQTFIRMSFLSSIDAHWFPVWNFKGSGTFSSNKASEEIRRNTPVC